MRGLGESSIIEIIIISIIINNNGERGRRGDGIGLVGAAALSPRVPSMVEYADRISDSVLYKLFCVQRCGAKSGAERPIVLSLSTPTMVS